MIRVFLIAASALARSGLEDLLKKRKVRVAGSAADLDAAQAMLAEAQADVLVMDASGAGIKPVAQDVAESGIAAEIPVVILASEPAGDGAATALRAGVRAVLPSDISSEQLVAALEAAAAGLVVMHPADIDAALPVAAPAAPPDELAEPLTPREREVLQMVAAGLGNKEIAARMAISEHTVKFHVASILGKLGAGSRTEAAALGIRRGLVMI